MNRVHRSVIALSGGRLGWKVGGMRVLKLTTTGRRSGQPHTVLLTSPFQVGETIVLVASRGGDRRHPAWFLNLRDRPDVEVAFARQPPERMRARVATSDEREALWPRVIAAYAGYARYQAKTDREIPLVFVERADTVSG